eukprot:851031-Alexandrium_andersonii.AAC.1
MGWVRTCPGSACPVAVAAWRSTRSEKLPARGCAAAPVRSKALASCSIIALARVAGGATSRVCMN